MSQILDENPRFAWVTHRGELILFEELVAEVRAELARQGISLDPWPCQCALQAVRRVTQDLIDNDEVWPTSDILLDRIERALRRRRILLNRCTLRAVLAAYLVQFERHDIAHTQLF